MKQLFETVFNSVRYNQPAALKFDINGNIYTRNFLPAERLILLGAGHIAQPLCTFASALDFSVVVADDRPSFANHLRFPEAEQVICGSFSNTIKQLQIQENDYVAVITRGHRYDADCLRQILSGTMPGYLGLIGSRRRTSGLMCLLEEEGYERFQLHQIHTPIGVDINALTTKEIAISIAAELIQYRRQNTSRHGRNKILTCEDIDLKLIEFLVKDTTPKAVMIVYETSGPTPAKSGAFMAIDNTYRTFGTIGGGCGEAAALREAIQVIGTGTQKSISIDLSNDVAEDEGMVCGGQMKVLIADIQ